MKQNYIQPATQVEKARIMSVLMASGGRAVLGKVGNIPDNTPLKWATVGAGAGAEACSGV